MIKFDSKDTNFKSPFGASEINTDILIRILISRRVEAMNVRIVMEGEQKITLPLSFSGIKGIYEEYYVNFSIDNVGLYFYHFEIENTDKNTIKIGKKNYNEADIQDNPVPWKLTVFKNTFTAFESYKGGNIYQIFPDRFCKAGILNKEKHTNIKQWGDIPNHIRNKDGTLDTSDFFGGNFKGIISKLGYLYSLGINIIYLNPIFESASNHRYDTGDYEKTDTLLGTYDEFCELCSECKKHNIKVILDGVFSHTGADSKYFNKYGNYSSIGAYQSKESVYYSWYKFREWPDDYECWWNVRILPETNETNSSYLSYITGKEGIARKWISAGASGWRLDVADELPDDFLSSFRNCVKAEKEDAIIIGEVWENAADKISYGKRRRYLLGDQLDSVMNYVFRNAVIDFFHNGDSDEFIRKIMDICEDYPPPVLHCLMNFLGTHDTERIKTILGSERRVCLAYALLAFLPGIPSIYYGDEAGMDGEKDPLNRLCYPWGKENKDMISFFSHINALRLKLDCLKDGKFISLKCDTNFLVFSRESNIEKCIFIINISDDRIPLPDFIVKATDLFTGKTYDNKSYIDKQDFIILKY